MLLDNLSKLQIIRKTPSYIQCTCPVCHNESPGIKISLNAKARGAYKCYANGCEPAKIREALNINPGKNYYLSPYKSKYQQSPFKSSINLNKIKPLTDLIDPKIILCEDYAPLTKTVKHFFKGKKQVCIYPYSHHQRVYRLDNLDSDEKEIYLQYLNTQNEWVLGVGEHTWQIYAHGLHHLFSNPSLGNTIVWVEGESTAEHLKNQGVAAITCATPTYNAETLEKIFYVLFATYKHIRNVIIVPDEDEPGYHKANLVTKICNHYKVSTNIKPVSDVLNINYEIKKGTDLADFDFKIKDLHLI